MPKILMTVGAVIFFAGAAAWLATKLGVPLGRLPGDISWQGKNVKVFAPFGTMLIVSLILTVLLNLIGKIKH